MSTFGHQLGEQLHHLGPRLAALAHTVTGQAGGLFGTHTVLAAIAGVGLLGAVIGALLRRLLIAVVLAGLVLALLGGHLLGATQ